MRKFGLLVSIVALLVVPATSSAALISNLTASDTSYANASTKVTRLVGKDKRIKLVLSASESVVPYTYDESYNKVLGAEVTRPVQKADANVTIECRAKSQRWYDATTQSTTMIPGTKTLRIPKNAYQCRYQLDVAATKTFSISNEDVLHVDVVLQVTTAR